MCAHSSSLAHTHSSLACAHSSLAHAYSPGTVSVMPFNLDSSHDLSCSPWRHITVSTPAQL